MIMAEAYLAGQQTVNISNTYNNTYPTYTTNNTTYAYPSLYLLPASSTYTLSTAAKYILVYIPRSTTGAWSWYPIGKGDKANPGGGSAYIYFYGNGLTVENGVTSSYQMIPCL
jgi:hypothetical protein